MTTNTKPLSIFGKITYIGGETVGENYKKMEFVILTGEKYPQNVAFVCFGTAVEELKRCKVGDNVNVLFSLRSTEHNSKWFSEIKAYKITIDFRAAKGGNNG